MAEISRDILVTPGVQTVTDFTTASTPHFVASDKIRFRDGIPEKIGGWETVTIDNNDPVRGCCRTIFSYNLNKSVRYLLGTQSNLYFLVGSTLTNITPLVTATTAIANSLSSNFGTLANDPITTTLSSTTITITDTATKIRAGDTITLSGSTAVNGVPAVEINTSHFVRSQATNSYTVIVTTAATSAGTGGGAAVVQATPIVSVAQTAHGFAEGGRIKMLGAVGFAGIPTGDLNIEHIIRTVTTNAYDIVVATVATSSVAAGGGAGTTVQGQIADGRCDGALQQGYGSGLYGVGLYGTALVSTSGALPARSWVVDRFGDNVIMTPGDQTGVFTWDSVVAVAPVLLTNAPAAVNYVFESNEIVVTLGAGNVLNRIQWSDQGVSTVWTPAATNQAGQDDIEKASEFLSHINVRGINLLFTGSQVFTFRYIRKPFVWETKLLDEKSGIISKNARVQHNGVAYWMGTDNFYYYRSGNVQIIPSNTTIETTLKKSIFDNISASQISKIFCWFNRKFNEVWWHIPSLSGSEPDTIVRLNVKELTWTPDTLERSAGEYPTQLQEFPFLASVAADDTASTIYQHEKGANDETSALAWSLSTPFFDSGLDTANVLGIIPDSLQTGNITCTVNVKKYPQSTKLYGTTALTVTPTSEIFSFRQNSRFIQYVLSGNVLNQTWRGGRWLEVLSKGGRR